MNLKIEREREREKLPPPKFNGRDAPWHLLSIECNGTERVHESPNMALDAANTTDSGHTEAGTGRRNRHILG